MAIGRETAAVAAKVRPAPAVPQRTTNGDGTPYGLAGLDAECRATASAAPGERHPALNRAAFATGQLIAGGELAESHVLAALRSAAAGLLAEGREREVERTIADGIEAGMREPRSAPERPRREPPPLHEDADRRPTGGSDESPTWTTEPDATTRERPATVSEPVPSEAAREALRDVKPATFDQGAAPTVRPVERFDLAGAIEHGVPEIPAVIDGWLAKEETAVLAGYGGAGKSLFLLDLAVALASGGEFLGFEIHGGARPTLYVDEENSPALIAWRIRKLAAGRGLSLDDVRGLPLVYWCRQGIDLDTAAGLDRFRRHAEPVRPVHVVLDSLCRFHHRDENSNPAMAEFFGTAITPLRRELGAEFIMGHHLAKPQGNAPRSLEHQIRGASEIRNYPDTVWGYEVESEQRTLKPLKYRWTCPAPVGVDLAESAATLRLSAGQGTSRAESIVLDYLRDADTEGAARQAVIRRVQVTLTLNEEAAAKVATRALGALWADGRTAKKGNRGGVRYWAREHAPADAEKACS